MTKAISCEIYTDRVEIKMFGQAPITITKPASVPWGEWNSFWGEKRYTTPFSAWPPFTQADVDANNRRRLQNINR